MLLNEFFKRPITEGGNLAIGQDQADTIDLKVHDRKFMIPLLNKLLVAINNSYAAVNKNPIWSAQTIQSRKFLSGSSLHFFDTNIPDEKFTQVKPKVGDIDTQVNKEMEPALAQWLDSHKGKPVGPATLVGYERGNEQFSSLWVFADPPIKIQIDLEFVGYEKDEPSQWAQFSHSSSWDDIQAGVKGVFHKFLIQSFTVLTKKDFLLRKMVGRGKARTEQDVPTNDNMLSFAVSSKEGGGLRAKYEPVLDANNEPLVIDGLPVMRALPPEDYDQDIGHMFATIFGDRVNPKQLKQLESKLWSFTGLLDVMNTVFSPEEKQQVIQTFLDKCYAKGAQGLYKNDPQRDAQEKDAAIKKMSEVLKVPMPAELKQMRQDYMATYRRVTAESLREADEQPAVKAQLRKGMPHLHNLKAADFLDLLDEIHDGNGRFKLENIPLNVKVDGFGGRFGKNKDGKPFMGTSRTEPRYEASFVKYHQQKGTTDPEILGRAQMFDDLFAEMMNAIKLVDNKLGPDFLLNKQVTCEVLFLPFAQETEDGKLKFVGIHYDKLPKGVKLALVPFHAVEADTGAPVEDPKFIDTLLDVGNQGSVMFINNRLTQNEGLDVTEIINVLDNIDELKQIVSDTAGKRDRASIQLKNEVEEKLLPIKEKLEQAIINDPNIIGKDMLGKDYEGIVINSRLGPIKVTSQEQRDVISAKLDAKKNARTERDRDNQNKTAVVAIGSFVGHKGHQQLFDYTINKAQELGGDPYLFMGNAVGKDDPIPVADKVKTWQQLYPQYSKNISAVTMEGGSLMQKVKHELINPLPGKPPRYDNIVIMVGEDQAKMPIATALMKAVNKFPGYEHVKARLEVTPRGTGMSFTKLRNILKTGNPNEQFTMWNDAFNGGEYGAKQLPPEWIKHLMDVTKKGMNIKTPSVTAPIKKQEQPAMAKPQQPEPQQEPLAESLRREIMIMRAEIAWLKESQNASQMAGPSGPEYDKTGGHHRLNGIREKWTKKYKSSINCSHPKGFSQKAHCAGKKKHNEDMSMEAVCPDCGMCESHGNLNEIKKGQKDSNGYTKCWTGYHAAGTKKSKTTGKSVRNCVPNEGMEGGGGQQLSVQQLATISDKALDNEYHYGRSQPGNTFGWQANLKSASYAKQMIDKGVTDVEAISDAIHKGWNVTAQAFVKDPMQFDDSKTMAPEKLQAKIAQRQKLMTQNYSQLPEEEKEKDRVVARAMLQAITGGQQGVAEGSEESYIIVRTNSEGKKDVFAGNFDTYEQAQKELDGLLAHPLHTKYKQKFEIKRKGQQGVAEGGAQQAAIAIAKKKSGKYNKDGKRIHEKQRLDAHCWTGYKKAGTKKKGGKRVNNCVKIGEGWENQISSLIKILESK